MMRKSIVYDKKTPNVFYCPLNKPTGNCILINKRFYFQVYIIWNTILGFDKLFVHSRPLKKLCEFDGKPLPEDYKSDCFQDVDETEYACKEKYRIMVRD